MNTRHPVLALLVVLLLSFSAPAGHPVRTPIKDPATGTEIGEQWYIDQPEVDTAHRDYPEIRYKVGDMVRVEAGGCVKTSKDPIACRRYVNPTGPDGDRLYSGTIRLPGAEPTTGLDTEVRIGRAVKVRDVRITAKKEDHDYSDYFLHLGYQDDDYTDNGYYAMDKGVDNQCNGVGWAWVRVTVFHNYGPAGPSRPKAPLDLWYEEVDANSLPLNPRWGYQVIHNRIPDAGPYVRTFKSWTAD
jgi:hypothetical protein